ncbi:MAG: ABC transporter substrate-binding protein [Clostridia bacterium]|nr:ABC transporter substrate-binding protein [Clostridia bacterium]
MNIKRIFSLVLCLALLVGALAGCAAPEEAVTLRVGGMKGPTTMGMVNLINASSEKTAEGDYEFTVAVNADELTPKFIKGELDIIAVPANLAANLYQKTKGEAQLLALNTLGVLYVVAKNESVSAISDLRGKTIYATGKGTTPEFTLRHILAKNGIDPDKDVTLEFKSEPTEIVALLKSSDSGIAMLPQPFVTVAKTNVEGLSVVLDLTREWEKVDTNSSVVTGVLVVRKSFAAEHPKAVETFLTEYAASVEKINSDPAASAALVEEYIGVKAPIATQAIPACNLVCITGKDMQPKIGGYLEALHAQNPAAVGGALPEADFYYAG